MLAIQAIDHIVLRTSNPDALINFYCTVLGCTIERKHESGFTQLRAGDSLIDVLPVDNLPDIQTRNVEHFCLRIQNFNYNELQDYFRSKNIELNNYGIRYGAQGMGESFYLKDPAGNEIELKACINSE